MSAILIVDQTGMTRLEKAAVARRLRDEGLLLRYKLYTDRRPETQEAIEAAVLAGESISVIAARYGVTSSAVAQRIRWRYGIGLSEFRRRNVKTMA